MDMNLPRTPPVYVTNVRSPKVADFILSSNYKLLTFLPRSCKFQLRKVLSASLWIILCKVPVWRKHPYVVWKGLKMVSLIAKMSVLIMKSLSASRGQAMKMFLLLGWNFLKRLPSFMCSCAVYGLFQFPAALNQFVFASWDLCNRRCSRPRMQQAHLHVDKYYTGRLLIDFYWFLFMFNRSVLSLDLRWYQNLADISNKACVVDLCSGYHRATCYYFWWINHSLPAEALCCFLLL